MEGDIKYDDENKFYHCEKGKTMGFSKTLTQLMTCFSHKWCYMWGPVISYYIWLGVFNYGSIFLSWWWFIIYLFYMKRNY